MASEPEHAVTAADKLSALPVELKTEIFNADTIWICELVSRHFRDIIEESKNEAALSKRGIDEPYMRLKSEAVALLQFSRDSPCAFIPAADAFFRHRGLALDPKIRDGEISLFAAIWEMREQHRDGDSRLEHGVRTVIKTGKLGSIIEDVLMKSRGWHSEGSYDSGFPDISRLHQSPQSERERAMDGQRGLGDEIVQSHPGPRAFPAGQALRS
ncbi:hypothetical protein DOTSEDRAFT_69792 [Dothistroma septosporum NZE10]|uniref:F-box domain-containing protein n=1 Tax=Dothistroma septosporum (strain NZE10 / CBS 128990) TaxID=675120 RepID=N1PX28_DOTSN|nr:hypothetical protein DOTSEDRAFT_69792 [Dothistroma septosporum NZE10]